MAGPGRIYRRGLIYYIAYRWDGREYRESARSAHVAAAERLLATRLAERQGHARSRALTFDALAAWYLDDYAVRRLRTLNTARGRVANLRAVFTGWQATVITSEAVRTYQRTRRAAGAAAATVNREISALSPMVQLAVRGGVVRLSPERSKTRVGRVLPISAPIRAVLARRRAQRRGRDPRVFRPDAVTVRAWRTAWPAAIRAAQAVPGYRRDSEGSRARHVVDTPPALCGPRHVAAPASGDRHRRAVESLGGPDRGAPVLAPLARRLRAGRGPHLFPSAAGRCPGRGLLRRPGDADGRRDRVGLPLRAGGRPGGLGSPPRSVVSLRAVDGRPHPLCGPCRRRVAMRCATPRAIRPGLEMARRKGTFWQREKGPLSRVVVPTWPDGAERREATSGRVPINALSSVERGPSGSVGRL